MKPKFSLKSLGCARSLVDSEQMIDQLNQVGFEMVPEGSAETIRVLNTCSFIQAAIAHHSKQENEYMILENYRQQLQKDENNIIKLVSN